MARRQAITAMRARKRESFDVFRETEDRLVRGEGRRSRWGWLAENHKGLLDQTGGAVPTTRRTAS